MDDRPIGIFDSGVGGTSIWKEIERLLPEEDTLYLADSQNAPYGDRPKAKIIALAENNAQHLIDQGCKLIVVACNTATTNAIAVLRGKYDLPFIGIEPAIKPAALGSTSKVIGVLATKGTLSSALFANTTETHAGGIGIVEQVGTGLVPLIEAGKAESKEAEMLLRRYLEPMLRAGMDHLVLGCSHYPYLMPLLKKLLPSTVKVIDSGAAVARQTKAVLERKGLLSPAKGPGKHRFLSNADTTVLEYLLRESRVHKNIGRFGV